jgi:predicted esterase
MGETTRFQVPGKLISDVAVRAPVGGDNATRIFLLLHGYSQDGQHMLKRLETPIAEWEKQSGGHALILAPSGTYPIPERSENGWHVGYSWYFYDFTTDEYYIDMENAVSLLNGIIAQATHGTVAHAPSGSVGQAGDGGIAARAGVQKTLPVTVIGFSQGGYLAPIFAKSCPQVDRVIGIGCEFLKDEIADPIRFRMDGVHGADDSIVDGLNSQKSHAALVARGVQGTFQLLTGEGHKISRAISECVKQLLLV